MQRRSYLDYLLVIVISLMVNNFKLIPNLDLSHNYQIQQMLELFNTDNLTRRHIYREKLFIY